MSVTPKGLSDRLLEEGERTASFYRQLSGDLFEHTVYSDGGCWKIKDILAHQAASEVSLRKLVENILAGGEGAPAEFDLNAYNERKVTGLRDRGVGELIELYLQARRETADLVEHMDISDLDKQGRHPFLGHACLLDMIKLIYRHNSIHIREIRHSLASAADQAAVTDTGGAG